MYDIFPLNPQTGGSVKRVSSSGVKLDKFSQLCLSHRPERLAKVLRYVKLNYFCHDNLLAPGESRWVRLRQIVRSPVSAAISAGATFIAAMIRTSCSVKPRVLIFHISAP